MEFNDEEEIIKTKSKMYIITILSVIGFIILSITIFVFSIESGFMSSFRTHFFTHFIFPYLNLFQFAT